MMYLTLFLTLLMSFFFTRMNHPLSLGLSLLFQTTLVCLTSGIMTHSFWFSYILFLIFLGGMLVLFIYVASLASNEPFMFSLSNFVLFFIFSIFLSFCFVIYTDPLSAPVINLISSSSVSLQHFSIPYTIMWIYNNPSMLFTLFIILYLLLTLIVVVKITNLFKGPLRLMK
uniref:NADH-ubiquinone oxidoreductase chain 6 n=1 Tax=Lyreidus brevifrons TaxID=1617980 RepID=A0A0D3QTK8_LYRBR|nr:NADH dehydrogenase subunit 6 [Lyreidus brevifrons]AJR19299.1 NADH dehydrogenase subunit 6 [Lyreidus brevifrons]